MWSLAHEQGIALPTRDFWEFDRLVTVSDPRGVPDLDSLDRIYHLTELIQSSPLAVERSVHGAIGGAYRSQRITTLELRFNPMKRNRGGEQDLDHIILAAIRGLDRASLEYPQVRAGLILMMDRTFTRRAEHGHRREGDPLRAARDRRRRHRGAAAGRRALRLHGDPRPRRDGARRRASASRSTSARRAAGSASRRSARSSTCCGPDRIGHGILAARRAGADGGAARGGDHARDLPDLEPADEGARRARTRCATTFRDVRRPRRPVHDRHRRPRDDADAPARRVRAAAPRRRARRGRGARGERARACGLVRRP